jgi:hypothetical protein
MPINPQDDAFNPDATVYTRHGNTREKKLNQLDLNSPCLSLSFNQILSQEDHH